MYECEVRLFLWSVTTRKKNVWSSAPLILNLGNRGKWSASRPGSLTPGETRPVPIE